MSMGCLLKDFLTFTSCLTHIDWVKACREADGTGSPIMAIPHESLAPRVIPKLLDGHENGWAQPTYSSSWENIQQKFLGPIATLQRGDIVAFRLLVCD